MMTSRNYGAPGGNDFYDVELEHSDDGGNVENFEPQILDHCSYFPKKGLGKYNSALKHLLPFRKTRKTKNVIQVHNAGFFSFITFSWLSGYIYQAYKKGLTCDDIPGCSIHDSCDLNAQRLGLMWQAELDRKGPENASFERAVWRFLQTRLLVSILIYIMSCMLGFLCPAIFMRKLIEFTQDPNSEIHTGLICILVLTLSEILKMMTQALYYAITYRTSVRLRAACLVLAYKKLIHVNSLGTQSIGGVINIYGGDGGRLYYLMIFGPMVIGGPIVVICCGFYIYFILGFWALLGLTTFVLFYPMQYILSRLTGYFRERAICKTDERIRLFTEILNTMKLIKIYAWEYCFMKQLQDVRNEEMSLLQKGTYCQSIGITMAPTVSVISGMVIFLIHVMSGANLTAAQAYPLITLLHSQLRISFLNLRYGIENIIDGRITFGRIQELLKLGEIERYEKCPPNENIALSVVDGFFTWFAHSGKSTPKKNKEQENNSIEKERLMEKTSQPFRLECINLSVEKGTLIGICGPVGSGKSSLLQACLGYMKKTSGELYKFGRTAYVSQDSWIENATLKENILFGEPFDPKKYINTLYCCDLNEDVNFLPAGDETEIGDRGVNLSGGQKKRVALARALYSNRDIYFLDDPLSAVDAQVASHVFEKCILQELHKKTVFLVTHQTKFLQKCDEILVMKDGKIIERGTHHELLSKEREYKCIVESSTLETLENCPEKVESHTDEQESNKCQKDDSVIKHSNPAPSKKLGAEEPTRGEVRPFAYLTYIKAAGGFFTSFLCITSIFINIGSTSSSSWWLAMWLKAGSGNTSIVDPSTNETVISTYINDNPDLNFYMQVYGCIIVIICLTSVLRAIIFTKVTMRASRVLYSSMVQKLMSSRLRYFETTPIGKIQNVFSRDFDEVDSRLPMSIETMVQNIWILIFAFLMITLVYPWFVIPLVFLAIIYYTVGKIFRVAIRDLKRITSISRTPIFGILSASLSGLHVIQAFGKENEYLAQFYKKFDEYSVCSYMSGSAMRWMAIRLDSISVVIVLTTSIFVVFMKGEVPPALAGLALTYSAHISGILQYTLRLMSETEGKFITVERILLAMQKLEQEESFKKNTEISPEWPSEGNIKFQNVVLSYSRELPPVLRGVSFTIRAGEKIGVVGRTGAGKSSLVTAIFRLVELHQGAIYIDGVDIKTVPLPVLRSRLSVIPQDPVIFSGTLRYNVDPFNKYTDDVIWDVLRKTKLYHKVFSMPNGLLTVVGEGGENFSFGENQLLCVARALLRGSKILILDEATASVDPDTEQAVQTVIGDSFKNCTILTIAHRLITMKNCEKVLVISGGMVQEFDDPNKLLENANSFFSTMVRTLK